MCTTLREYPFVTRRLAPIMVRADMQRRSAIHNFGKWYTQLSSQFWNSSFEVGIYNSQLNVTRRALPHTLLYFLIQVLQRMLDQFWDTAEQNAYVMRCARAHGRCPPSIIAALFYYECKALNPCILWSMLGGSCSRRVP